MFDKVLIANRGEIACRIIATLRRLGIRSVAVYSDADAAARHVHLADEAVRIGPAPAAQSYLDIAAIIDAARRTGAQAIHPGYGFLAENAAFARACADAGIVFIGPSPDAMATMGDKITAKIAVAERGVPTVPGVARPGLTDDDLVAASADVGYPLLIKPSAGGGGKGMHVVTAPDELVPALAAARREAAASFGDDTLFLERYVQSPRHIEVQVLADAHGNVVHLGERECSLQRRHQKVIEEAPSPLLDAAARERIGAAACETARSVAYRGAGTVEFIVSADRPDEFFFMEMNTRLQVEHPVTEQVTGIDLVEAQLRIAAGEPLAFAQSDVRLDGHSIEARVYAEDPRAGFLPTGGHLSEVRHPSGEGIRVDTALEDGLDVVLDYDPMLAKIIAWGPDRDEARRRLVRALDDTAVFGVTTNVEFLRLLLELPAVARGDLDTGLIERELAGLHFTDPDAAAWAEAALLLDTAALDGAGLPDDAALGGAAGGAAGPWSRRDGWRLGPAAARVYRLEDDAGGGATARVWGSREDLEVAVDAGERHPARVRLDDLAHVSVAGSSRSFAARVTARSVELTRGGATFAMRIADAAHGAQDGGDETPHLDSPMPGTVVMLRVADGARVEAGDPVVVVEAMKMEHVVRSTIAGVVELHVGVGDQVSRGRTLATVTPDA
ncbi:acetyl-CoA carboxylase biotin carboxylase subunit [Microbacterium sp. SS28]|uniref:acetyl/propionyl/methylcrotonyl-CoA carboxylase subunit alpha n=1 Tax=Microbacterium sp. SS28 TaxID=2919948 RepID=UPI001FAAFA2B|nr:acetyl-CoA carboxylase biotin carboxylase subunit [Microbacterium sp. SS28]